jgi:hypothetical protein
MPANDTSTDSPLTFGDLLAALMVISEKGSFPLLQRINQIISDVSLSKAPPRSLVSRLQNVSCSFGDGTY